MYVYVYILFQSGLIIKQDILGPLQNANGCLNLTMMLILKI